MLNNKKIRNWKDIRCIKCRRLFGRFDKNRPSLGIIIYKCKNSRCKTFNNIFLYKNKFYIIDKKLLLKKKFLLSLKQKPLTRPYYDRIIKLINL